MEILTCSARDYIASYNGEDLSYYKLIGVQATGNFDEMLGRLEKKAQEVGAEVVTDLQVIKYQGFHSGFGTALVRK